MLADLRIFLIQFVFPATGMSEKPTNLLCFFLKNSNFISMISYASAIGGCNTTVGPKDKQDSVFFSEPKMTGDILAKKILSIRPGIPIILCTGFSNKINREKAMDMGIRALTGAEGRCLTDLTVSRDSHVAAVLPDNPGTACCWLGGLADNIAGWSLLRWFRPEIQAFLNAYISVFVSPEHRGKGIGRLLVHAALDHDEEQEMTPIFFTSTAQQTAFYRSWGILSEFMTSHPFPRRYWDHARFIKRRLLRPRNRSCTWRRLNFLSDSNAQENLRWFKNPPTKNWAKR